MSIDKAMRELMRDVVRDAVRDELDARLGQHAGTLPQTEPGEDYVSAKTAAAIAGVNEETVRVWVRRGALQAHWAGRLLRIKRAEIDQFMATGGNDADDGMDADEFAKRALAPKG